MSQFFCILKRNLRTRRSFFSDFLLPYTCVVLNYLIKLIIRYKKKTAHTIIVDNEGVFYKKYDGSTESILYEYLRHSKTNYLNDIFTRSVPVDGHNLIYLKVYYGGQEIKVDFGRIDSFRILCTKPHDSAFSFFKWHQTFSA